MSERVLRADHEAQAVFIDVVHFQIRRLDGQGNDADVDGAVLDALENLVTEVTVDADVHQGIAALKSAKMSGADRGRWLHWRRRRPGPERRCRGRHNLNGFVAHAQQLFRILEKNFTWGVSSTDLANGRGGGLVGLLELAILRTDSGL